MIYRLTSLVLLSVLALPVALGGGVEFGEYGKSGLVRCGKFQICKSFQSLNGRFAIAGVRWVGRDGTWTARRVSTDLLDNPALIAPAGEWVGIVLLLEGPVELWGERADGTSFDYVLELNTITVPLDSIAKRGDGVFVSLPADIDGLDAAGLEALLRDGARGWIE